MTIQLANGSLRQVPLDHIRAVAAARITPFEPGAKSFDLIDLVMDANVVRFLVHTFDPRTLFPSESDQERALTAFLDQLLLGSGATPLPDPQAARGQPFACYLSLQDYEARILDQETRELSEIL